MRALPLIILVALILVALAVFFTVRAIRSRRAKKRVEQGYVVWQLDVGEDTQIRISRPNKVGRIEAVVPLDDPNYSNRVIEEYAKAEAKAREWNSTKRALELDRSV